MMARPQQWSLLDKKEGELSQGAHPFLFLSADGESLDVKISRPRGWIAAIFRLLAPHLFLSFSP